MRIDYSGDDGMIWKGIAESVFGDSYEWSVVNEETSTARIRVTSMQDTSIHLMSSAFTIERRRAGGLVQMSTKPNGTWGLAFDGRYLWTTLERGAVLQKLDPNTLATLASIRLSFADTSSYFSDITYNAHRGTFFLHDVTDAYTQNTGWLCEVDTAGVLLNRWRSPCTYPSGLVWLGDDNDSSGLLLASDVFGAQNFYLIDPDDGALLRTIPPQELVEFGPSGLASAGDGRNVWQVMAGFHPEFGPLPARAILHDLDAEHRSCAFPLVITSDSASAGGHMQWGRISARGIERDPRDGNLWVTGIDGSIYKLIPCEAAVLDVGEEPVTGSLRIEVLPNPSHGRVTIRYALDRTGHVRLAIHDTEGRLIEGVVDGDMLPGEHNLQLDGDHLVSGIYIVRLVVDGRGVASHPLVIVK